MNNEENLSTSDQILKVASSATKTEEAYRPLPNIVIKILKWLAVLLALYHLSFPLGLIRLAGMAHQANHLAILIILTFSYYPLFKSSKKVYNNIALIIDIILATVGLIACAYISIMFTYFEEAIIARGGFPTDLEMILGVLIIIVVLELTRRIVGWILPVLCLFFMFYAMYANYFPGVFLGRGFSFERVISLTYLWTNGIFGIALHVAASYIFMFILFAVFFARSGMAQILLEIALGLFGAVRGGPAKVSVVGSMLFGSISGSTTANIMTTGAFSIPLMKKLGFKPEFAGAVEAVASTGGQFMPPMMAATAFVMAEFLQVSYGDVVIAAAIPGVLFYLSLYFMIDMESQKLGLKGLPKKELPSALQAFKRGWYLFLPLVVLIYLLVGLYWSPSASAFWSMVSILVVSSIKKESRFSLRSIIEVFEQAAKNAIAPTIACAAVGIIIGVVTITGLGINLSGVLIDISRGSLPVLLFLTMVVSIILGLGVTPTVIYISLAIMVAPALVELGVDRMAAHLFVLYYGILSFITPPVCIASFVAAGLARSSPMRTGFVAWKIGLAAFILPFMWVYGPSLLMQGSFSTIITTIITSSLGIWALAGSLQGWCLDKINWLQRLLLFSSAIILISPNIYLDLIGAVILLLVVLSNVLSRYKIAHGKKASSLPSDS